jgi:hypothetical protein
MKRLITSRVGQTQREREMVKKNWKNNLKIEEPETGLESESYSPREFRSHRNNFLIVVKYKNNNDNHKKKVRKKLAMNFLGFDETSTGFLT